MAVNGWCPAATDSAERLASHFMREVDGGGGASSGSSAFFNRAASYTLQRLILTADLEGPVETRGGIYATVAAAVSCLNVGSVARWIPRRTPGATPPTGMDKIDEFVPWELVASELGDRHATLYLLSREGTGTSRVLLAALSTGSSSSPASPLPLAVMLDQAANVCRIDALPDLYSFFGFKGSR